MRINTELGLERLNKVLINDKYIEPNALMGVLKNDMLNVLSSYLDYNPESCEITLEVNELGEYEFSFFIVSKRVKFFGMLPN